MARLADRVDDKKVLRLIRRYLDAGVMVDGVRAPTERGTPQGSPLSPLLSNVYLDDLDKELDRRGHRFVRYADDLVIYTKSKRAGERVMASVSALIEDRLKLKVNRRKSAVDHATRRPLLSFGFFRRDGEIKVRIDPDARKRAKGKLRRITARSWGVSMERRIDATNGFIRGWVGYFHIADTPRPFEDLDQWLRRRLRQARWKQWKARPEQGAQPAGARHPRSKGPRVGQHGQGKLAHRGLRTASPRDAQRLLAQPGPARIQRLLPPSSGR